MNTPVNDNLLRIFIKNTPTAVAMLNNEMRYIFVSDRWIEDYGLDEDEIIGRSHYSDEGDIVAVEGLVIDITNQVTPDKTFNKLIPDKLM